MEGFITDRKEDELKVIATINRSAGNDTVGDMWQETAIFNESQSITEVLEWATRRNNNAIKPNLKDTIKITIAQDMESNNG